MKSVNMTIVTITVYGLSVLLVLAFSVAGQLGSLSLFSGNGWFIVGWLAGYLTIAVLLVGGTAHWVFTEAMPLIRKQLKRSLSDEKGS
ncbi:hypothetical protein [Marinobacter sp. F3R08]|uniref:hypothetical protein n=1 Tax=Marinobacter sp. F3R08 TaxID=2841559 RepID=UPI001C081063|nr:hypothetical protein [Marinobacter sp. F3R08]MBU2952325.1 hypothetical protein [Marinobacter sp. F3R08]